MESIDWQCVYEAGAEIGEEPIWTPDGTLFWVDVLGNSFNRLSLSSARNETWDLGETVGTYALTVDPDIVLVAVKSGLVSLDLKRRTISRVVTAPYDTAHYRLNDGRCDRAGRFWVGTVRLPDSPHANGGGAFYRFDERGFLPGVQDVTIANGLAWSPDNKKMYIADRPNWQILVYDYDIASGNATNGRVFATFPVGHIPDGAAVDEEGGYWIAVYAQGRILRYLPDGTLDREIKAPTSHPTMISFGGDDYRTLFVTTAASHLKADARNKLDGAIFSTRSLGARGIPEPRLADHLIAYVRNGLK